MIRPIVARFGPRNALIAGLLFGAAAMTVYGLAAAPLAFCFGIPLGALWGIANPSAQQLMTQRVGLDQQGRLQGANASLQAIGNFIGPLLFTQVFAATAQWARPLSGLAFVQAAVLLLIAALAAVIATRTHHTAA